MRDATILLLVNYILAADAAAKVRQLMFYNNLFDCWTGWGGRVKGLRDESFRLSSDVGFTVGVQALAASAAAAAATAAPTDPACGVPCQPGLDSAVLSLSL